MLTANRLINIGLLGLAGLLAVASACNRHGDDRGALGSPADEGTAVRFFFQGENYFHAPLVFRVALSGDPRLNSAPMQPAGRTVYISLSDMDRLKQGLAHLHLSWRESKEVEVFEDAINIPPAYEMSITVVSSRGTAKTDFDPAKICETLAQLDPSLAAPRAKWELQIFRAGYGCRVPGLDGQAYPDHWPK